MLWTDHWLAKFTPLTVWILGFMALLVWTVVAGDQLIPNNIRTVLLLFAGFSGGIWPAVKGK